jgi:nitrate reductase NapD
MNVCGVLVHAFPDQVAEVVSALERLSGVELHGRAEGGRLIVSIEDAPSAKAIDGLAAIHALPGVVAAALVYHHCEPAPADAGAPAREASS